MKLFVFILFSLFFVASVLAHSHPLEGTWQDSRFGGIAYICQGDDDDHFQGTFSQIGFFQGSYNDDEDEEDYGKWTGTYVYGGLDFEGLLRDTSGVFVLEYDESEPNVFHGFYQGDHKKDNGKWTFTRVSNNEPSPNYECLYNEGDEVTNQTLIAVWNGFGTTDDLHLCGSEKKPRGSSDNLYWYLASNDHGETGAGRIYNSDGDGADALIRVVGDGSQVAGWIWTGDNQDAGTFPVFARADLVNDYSDNDDGEPDDEDEAQCEKNEDFKKNSSDKTSGASSLVFSFATILICSIAYVFF